MRYRFRFIRFTQYRCLFLLILLFILKCCFDLLGDSNTSRAKNLKYNVVNDTKAGIAIESYYKYPLESGFKVAMDFFYYNSSYHWFMAMKPLLKNIDVTQEYSEEQLCNLWPLSKTFEVDRQVNLGIFLLHIHKYLKKQLLEYRIFVIEQFGTEKFNKGTLYNIAYLETQLFGTWDCLIFHDVDLIPEDERIPYTCSNHPIHLAASVESFNYSLLYPTIFGGVTALTPEQYRTVNGYSNFYWDWGGEDDDFYNRIEGQNMTIIRYNLTYGRYATLPHKRNAEGSERGLLLMISKKRAQKEGLITTVYRLIKVVKEKLYTHILADVNPTKMKLDIKTLIQKLLELYGDSIVFGLEEFRLGYPLKTKLTVKMLKLKKKRFTKSISHG
ncbi:beta-1,4-galactosyltransferase 4-like [Spodoptera litura]|uniref:Beta-1,4-N-acetylgalactosaminyltransferase n=1 Tax=Spodoptera litura TaxID=69820 RepID=A0A9J7ITW5_SPOLT|nr:beta-1,4-galactosyltransferase 4-like [Spodoptera litura]